MEFQIIVIVIAVLIQFMLCDFLVIRHHNYQVKQWSRLFIELSKEFTRIHDKIRETNDKLQKI